MDKPFDTDGAFVDNIRIEMPEDDSELRESLKANGWSREFPALVDENGVVLVGHRRMKIAKSLGIEPVTKTIRFGKGDAADAERIRLAIISNIGAKPLTAKDRRHIAEHLYGKEEWTMQRIAKALSVNHATVSRDLKEFVQPAQTSRPKGGRPKGTQKQATPVLDKAREIVRPLVEEGKPTPSRKLQEEHGISHVHIETAIAVEKAVIADRVENPDIRRQDLSLTAQQKFDAAIRQHKKTLAEQFEAQVRAKVDAELERLVLGYYREKVDQYDKVINAHKGLMPRAVYRLILSCLHPDSRASVSDKRLADAMNAFQSREVVLCLKDAGDAAPAFNWPRTPEELAARRREVSEKRRAKRTKNGVSRA